MWVIIIHYRISTGDDSPLPDCRPSTASINLTDDAAAVQGPRLAVPSPPQTRDRQPTARQSSRVGFNLQSLTTSSTPKSATNTNSSASSSSKRSRRREKKVTKTLAIVLGKIINEFIKKNGQYKFAKRRNAVASEALTLCKPFSGINWLYNQTKMLENQWRTFHS